MKARMSNSSALLKQEFLRKWIKGLQIYSNLNKDMNISDRKKAIKLSADVAIASTRKAATHWSHALMNDVVSRDDGTNNRIVVEQILGSELVEKKSSTGLMITCSKRILRRSRIARCRKARRVVPRDDDQCVNKASSIAKKLVKMRTRVLKRLVPGGEDMDEVSLIRETLDYIVSLRVQVDVMRRIAGGADRLEPLKRSLIN